MIGSNNVALLAGSNGFLPVKAATIYFSSASKSETSELPADPTLPSLSLFSGD